MIFKSGRREDERFVINEGLGEYENHDGDEAHDFTRDEKEEKRWSQEIVNLYEMGWI